MEDINDNIYCVEKINYIIMIAFTDNNMIHIIQLINEKYYIQIVVLINILLYNISNDLKF